MNDVRPTEDLGELNDYEPPEVDPDEPATWPTLGQQEPPVEADPVDWIDQQKPATESPFGDEDDWVDDDAQ